MVVESVPNNRILSTRTYLASQVPVTTTDVVRVERSTLTTSAVIAGTRQAWDRARKPPHLQCLQITPFKETVAREYCNVHRVKLF